MIPVDYDQADWGSTRIYGDGELSGLWGPDKVIPHWGGGTVPPLTRRGERSLLRGWQRYHRNVKGWRDIAYGYAVGNSGSIYRLRGLNPQGATSGDYEGDGIPENNEGVACVWLGGSGGRISKKAYEAMGKLVRSVLAEIGSDVVIGHRDVKHNTTCPGDAWWQWIQEAGWVDTDEEDAMIIEALKAQNTAWYQALQNQTGTPGGDPSYWGDNLASDEEWETAAPILFAAALEAGVMHPAGTPGIPAGTKFSATVN